MDREDAEKELLGLVVHDHDALKIRLDIPAKKKNSPETVLVEVILHAGGQQEASQDTNGLVEALSKHNQRVGGLVHRNNVHKEYGNDDGVHDDHPKSLKVGGILYKMKRKEQNRKEKNQ